ncbi:MAG: PEP-CTERM sorting domain-containing protein [Opitutaceae bacterium]|nr:PEP-CTERM sorting domain-containing protein [Opitutaceae bacterium]MBP9912219.1 PEP-CTERM sorting domain-containing protein [Opitutaceae bacterium]
MQIRTLPRILAVLGLWNSVYALVAGQEISSYGLGVIQTGTQIDAAAPAVDVAPFVFQAFINSGSVDATTATVQAPGGTVYNLGNDAEYNFGTSYRSAGFASLAALDMVFANTGTYTLYFNTPATEPNGVAVNTLQFGSPDFPMDIPRVTGGGTWADGAFHFDVLQEDGQISFTPFSNMVTDQDLIIFDIYSEVPGDFRASRTVTQSSSSSFGISGPSQNDGTPYFIPGDSYTALITFIKVVDADHGASLAGTDGIAFYATQTKFNFVAVPEPSTYGLLALGLGVILLPALRRRLRR